MTLSAKVAELRERHKVLLSYASVDFVPPYIDDGTQDIRIGKFYDAVWLARDALALLSEREADAERYRWLRDRTSVTNGAIGYTWDKTPSRLAATDSAIDAALAEKGPRQ